MAAHREAELLDQYGRHRCRRWRRGRCGDVGAGDAGGGATRGGRDAGGGDAGGGGKAARWRSIKCAAHAEIRDGAASPAADSEGRRAVVIGQRHVDDRGKHTIWLDWRDTAQDIEVALP